MAVLSCKHCSSVPSSFSERGLVCMLLYFFLSHLISFLSFPLVSKGNKSAEALWLKLFKEYPVVPRKEGEMKNVLKIQYFYPTSIFLYNILLVSFVSLLGFCVCHVPFLFPFSVRLLFHSLTLYIGPNQLPHFCSQSPEAQQWFCFLLYIKKHTHNSLKD